MLPPEILWVLSTISNSVAINISAISRSDLAKWHWQSLRSKSLRERKNSRGSSPTRSTLTTALQVIRASIARRLQFDKNLGVDYRRQCFSDRKPSRQE